MTCVKDLFLVLLEEQVRTVVNSMLEARSEIRSVADFRAKFVALAHVRCRFVDNMEWQ